MEGQTSRIEGAGLGGGLDFGKEFGVVLLQPLELLGCQGKRRRGRPNLSLGGGKDVAGEVLGEGELSGPGPGNLAPGLRVSPQPGRVNVAMTCGHNLVLGIAVALREEGTTNGTRLLKRGLVLHIGRLNHLLKLIKKVRRVEGGEGSADGMGSLPSTIGFLAHFLGHAEDELHVEEEVPRRTIDRAQLGRFECEGLRARELVIKY